MWLATAPGTACACPDLHTHKLPPAPTPAQPTPTHHAVAEVEPHNHLLEDPARLILRQPVVQAALAQEAVQLRGGEHHRALACVERTLGARIGEGAGRAQQPHAGAKAWMAERHG